MIFQNWTGNDDVCVRGRIDELEYTVNGERVRRNLAEERAALAAGKNGQRACEVVGLTFDEAWSAYLAAVNRPDSGPRTLADYERHYRCFVKWVAKKHVKCRCLRDINEDIAEKYAAHLLRKVKNTKTGKTTKTDYSAGTFNKHISFLQLMYRVLQKKAKIDSNPWADIVRKRENRQSRRELTVEEIDTVCNSAQGR